MCRKLAAMMGLWILVSATAALAQGTWSTSSLWNLPCVGGSAASAAGKVFFSEGSKGGHYSSFVLVFDTINYNARSWLFLPTGHYAGDLCSAGGNVFFVGNATLDIYDTSTGSWATETLPGYKKGPVCASANGLVFVPTVDGNGASEQMNIYDSVSHSWSAASLIANRGSFQAAVSCGSQVLFGGGLDSTTGLTSSSVDIYDTSTQIWTTAALSQARSRLAATSAGSLVFFGGGVSAGTTQSSVVDIYDTVGRTWNTASLSQARGALTATSVGNYVLFAGGTGEGSQTSNAVDIYDITAGTWKTAPLSQARWQLVSASANDEAFFAGGYPVFPYWDTSDVVDIFTIPEPATLSLLVLGGAALTGLRRRKRSAECPVRRAECGGVQDK